MLFNLLSQNEAAVLVNVIFFFKKKGSAREKKLCIYRKYDVEAKTRTNSVQPLKPSCMCVLITCPIDSEIKEPIWPWGFGFLRSQCDINDTTITVTKTGKYRPSCSEVHSVCSLIFTNKFFRFWHDHINYSYNMI